MAGALDDINSLFGDDKSFYDILNIKKEASKDDVKYYTDTLTCYFSANKAFSV